MTEAGPVRSPSSDAPAAAGHERVCPRCGSPIAVNEHAVIAGDKSARRAPAGSPIVVCEETRPRGAGLLVLALTCAPSAIFAGIALWLLADDRWVGGFVFVGLALVSAAALLAVISREPDGPLGQQALAVAARARISARMACVSVAAWSRAVRALIRVRRRQQRLYAARKDRLAALAEAILRGDRAHAARLKAETRDLGEEMRARDDEASDAIDSAREQIERERAANRAVVARVG
jgi:hypothetical protein